MLGKEEAEQGESHLHGSNTRTYFASVVLSDAATLGKKKLVENTDRESAKGAFGLPWMTCVNARG